METETQTIPASLKAAIEYFSDPDRCLAFAVKVVWPDGKPVCPHCKSYDAHFISTRRIWRCRSCKKQYSLKVGTIFEDSPIGLDKWMMAVWLIANCKNGISSYELARDIEVMQRTAWFMLHRIRFAMKSESFEKMDGPVEADETFIGGLEKNKHENKKLHAGRGSVGKTIVMGVLERSEKKMDTLSGKVKTVKPSRVKAGVITDTSKATLSAVIKAEVKEFATLYTDAWKGYNGLKTEYLHEFVDHAVCYAIGQVHTNGIENFWSLLKRCLKGTYISVEPFHLEAYIDEQAFRFNYRGNTDGERFLMALGSISGKRLTYDELTSSYEEYYAMTMPV